MEALELAVVIGTAVLVLTWLARRTGLNEPAALLLGGVALGFAPGLRDVALPPDVVLFLFLPALLYWETLSTSLREIRSNLRAIVLLAVGLVLATAGVVAAGAHALGMPWATAFVLGAVLAPTDATAVAAVAGALPRRALTTLRTESLVNDGTALVVFGVATGVAVRGESFSPGGAVLAFVGSYAGGAAAGLVTAGVVVLMRRLFVDSLLQGGVSLLTPLLAYLAAEAVHVSGVFAVVVCGLVLAHVGPLLIPARTRVQAEGFWSLTAFVLNGALFVLVGLQIPQAVRALGERPSVDAREVAAYAAVATAAVVGTRLAWMYTVPYVIRALDRRPQQRLRRVGARARFPSAWAGVRGGVSLAAALAIPATVATTGRPFEARELVVVVTAAVILVTVVVQGQTLPAVIRWAHLPPDAREHDEEVLARRSVTTAALTALPGEARRLATPDAVREAYAAELRSHLEDLDHADDPDAEGHRARDADVELRLALLGSKRRALVELRDRGRIDDTVLQRVQTTLDVEEVRLSARRQDGGPVGTPSEGAPAVPVVNGEGEPVADQASPSGVP